MHLITFATHRQLQENTTHCHTQTQCKKHLELTRIDYNLIEYSVFFFKKSLFY